MGYLFLQLQRLTEGIIFSVGNHLTISIAGIPFFGFTVPYMIGAYTVAIAVRGGQSLTVAVLLALILAAIVGIFFALLYRRLSTDGFAVFTVAAIFAFDALLRSWSSVTGGVLGISGIKRPVFIADTRSLLIFTAIAAVIVLTLEYVLLQSSFGRALQAHKESPRLLDAAGRSAKRIGSLVVVICALLAGVSGIIGAWRIQFLDPTFGNINTFIYGLTVAILAHKNKVSWIVWATTAIIALPELLRFFPFPESIFGYMRQLVYAIALIVLVHIIGAKYTNEKRIV